MADFTCGGCSGIDRNAFCRKSARPAGYRVHLVVIKRLVVFNHSLYLSNC
jgi:hypothetical protein